MALQLCKLAGAKAVAVVSNESKYDYCKRLGAVGCINRRDFNHWRRLPNWEETEEMNEFNAGARAFGKAIWDVLGERRNPRIVFEHPGQDTVPTSIFVADTGGMVVICAGTTGYNADVDLRYLWMRQKRLQGSHFANDDQAKAFNDLALAGKIDPCLSQVFPFDGTGDCHQVMYENRTVYGNMAILVGAPREGMTTLTD
jgi:crotonyl-CoA carboxylase/reductase